MVAEHKILNWAETDSERLVPLLNEINPHLPEPVDPVQSELHEDKIPYYPDYTFYRVTDHSKQPSVKKYIFYKPGAEGPADIRVVNYNNQLLYDLAEDAPIKLTKDNVGHYIKFFFHNVRGKHGHFIIVEDLEDMTWLDEPPEEGRKYLADQIKPVDVKSLDKDGTFHGTCHLLLKNALFSTNFTVTEKGLIALTGEQLLLEDIPIVQED